MTVRNRARVCALGTQADMIRLCRTLLDNCQWFDEPEDNTPDLTLEQLQAIIAKHARAEGGEQSTFCYEMVDEHPYGDAINATCRLSIRQHPTGLYLALFTYDSDTPFQPEDWAHLHLKLRMLPMLALYANDDFTLENGMKLIVGGRIGDDWGAMGAAWLYLIGQYEEGYPPEEAVLRLRKLRATIEREELDQDIADLLEGCISRLGDLESETHDTDELVRLMQEYRAAKDFESLMNLYLTLIEAELWDIPRYDRHMACLQSINTAWRAAEGLDDEDDED